MTHALPTLCAALLLSLAGTGASLAQAPPPAPTLEVRRYAVQGPLPISTAQVDALLAPYRGRDRTLADIDAAAGALEEYLHDGGHPFHRVVVPAQRPEAGEVRLEVVVFTVGEVQVAGHQHFSEAQVRASLPSLREGRPPALDRLAAELAVANTNPARQASVTFRESSRPGAVDALVRVRDQPPGTFLLAATAHHALGGDDAHEDVLRLGGTWQHADVAGRGHVLTVSWGTDPRDVKGVRLLALHYEVPLPRWGLTAAAFHTDSQVRSARVLQGLDALEVSGSGRFTGLRLTRTLPRRAGVQPTLALALEDRVFRNTSTVRGERLLPDVGSRVWSLQLGLRGEPAWGAWSAALDWAGNVGGGTANTEAHHAANGGERDWRFWRWSADAGLLARGWQLGARTRGQYARTRLVAGEQFGIGGSHSVRGFSDRVATGERGALWNLEAIGPPWGPGARPVLFVDIGSVRARASGRRESLLSAGVGVRWGRPDWQLALDLARVLDGVSGAADAPWRLHLALLARF